MQSKNYKKSYLLNLLQTIDNNQYNLKANKGKKIYDPSVKKGFKYKPETDLKSGKRFIPKNLPDYSTAKQKLKTDKSLYARDILKGHIETEFINEIISTIDKPELDYLYNSGPYIINQLDKNYNKSAITPKIFIEFLQSLYNKQNLNAVKEDEDDSGSEPDLSHRSYMSDEALKRYQDDEAEALRIFRKQTAQNASSMGKIEAEAEAEAQNASLMDEIEAEAEAKAEANGANEEEEEKPKAKSKKQKKQRIFKTLETTLYGDPIEGFKEFKDIRFTKAFKQGILEDKFDELSPFFTYFGQPIEIKYIPKLKVSDLNKGFKRFFETD